MSFSDVENAVQAWLVAATGYAGTSCIWANQTAARPESDFATLSFGDTAALGAYDATAEYVDLTRPAGTEVERRVMGWRELVLTVQVFAAASTGNTQARTVLQHALLQLNFDSVSAALTAVGLGLFDLGTVQSLPIIQGSKFQSHAVVEARFYYQDTASEFTGYIATVEDPSPTYQFAVVADVP